MSINRLPVSQTSERQAPKGAKLLRIADTEFEAVSEGRVRIWIGFVLFLAVLGIIVLRLAGIALFTEPRKPVFFSDGSDKARADILDRNGELLATSIETFSVYAEPRKVWNPAETATAIHRVRPNLDYDKLLTRLSADKGMVFLERNLSPKEWQQVFELGLPGIGVKTEPKRIYPRGRTAAHVLGFTDIDLRGAAGVERAFDTDLAGKSEPVTLSVDLSVQFALEDELRATMTKFHAKAASGVVMNVKTGEVLGMASLPDYDANMVNTTSSQELMNLATMATYELGSTFKPLTIAMALDTQSSNLTEEFPVHKPVVIRRHAFRDDHPSRVPLAMADILRESSNKGTVLLSERIGDDAMKRYLTAFGLMDRMPLELAESAAPQVQRDWQDLTTGTVSFGHGMSVTPLALTAALGSVMNGGEYIVPTFRKASAVHAAPRRRVLVPTTSKTVVDMMRYVVTDGTGRNAEVKGYGVIGKTGTAEKPAIGGYAEKRLITSFVAGFPYTDPTYIVFVVLDEPQAIEGTYGYSTAGWNAAPTAGNIVERIAPILGLSPEPDASKLLSPFKIKGTN